MHADKRCLLPIMSLCQLKQYVTTKTLLFTVFIGIFLLVIYIHVHAAMPVAMPQSAKLPVSVITNALDFCTMPL